MQTEISLEEIEALKNRIAFLEREIRRLHAWRQQVVDLIGMPPGEHIANPDGSMHANVYEAINKRSCDE